MNIERKEVPARAKRNYKDTLFRMIFKEPKALLSLYNAINGTDYTDTEKLEIVTQLNIKTGHKKELLEKCAVLKEYSQYIEKVQRHIREKNLNEAVEQAVQECIKEGILSDFLAKNRAEAISVSIFEYDEERELALLRQGERELGMEAGGLKKMVFLTRKKSDKGLSVAEIAELLEEKEERIREILEVIASNPNASDEEVALIIVRR